jgi:hypothetical protein
MSNDILNTLALRRLISPFRQTNSSTAVVSQILDRQGFDRVGIVIQTGDLTDANATFAATLEESNDSGMSGATAVAAADLVGGTVASALNFAFGDDNVFKQIGYVGTKRYLRLTITPTGNDAGNLDVSAFAVLGGGMKQP